MREAGRLVWVRPLLFIHGPPTTPHGHALHRRRHRGQGHTRVLDFSAGRERPAWQQRCAVPDVVRRHDIAWSARSDCWHSPSMALRYRHARALPHRHRCLALKQTSGAGPGPHRPGGAYAGRAVNRIRHVCLCYFSNLKRARPDDRARARRLDPTATRARPLRQSERRPGPASQRRLARRHRTTETTIADAQHAQQDTRTRTQLHQPSMAPRPHSPEQPRRLADHNNQNADPRQQHTTRTRSHVCQSRAVRMQWTSRHQSQKRSFATRGAQRAASHRPWRRPPPALCSIRASAEQTPPLFRDALALPQYLPAPAAGVIDSSRILRQ